MGEASPRYARFRHRPVPFQPPAYTHPLFSIPFDPAFFPLFSLLSVFIPIALSTSPASALDLLCDFARHASGAHECVAVAFATRLLFELSLGLCAGKLSLALLARNFGDEV